MRVLVIGGGISDEREISLRSSKAVFNAISDKHEKEFYDWNGSDDWIVNNAQKFDVALPILHGEGGEDGQIQAVLEKSNLKYLGANVEVSKLCMDKVKTQKKLAKNGILVPKQAVVNYQSYKNHNISNSAHVIKPINGGSSLDTFLLRDGRLGDNQAKELFDKYKELIIEDLIEGEEVTVPVLDGYDLPMIHIVPPEGVFFDYENKYNGATQEICNPDTIDQRVQNEVIELAKKCHQAVDCRHLSRIDFILSENGEIYVLEINTIPGLTDQSLFPKAAAHVGMSMQELVGYFIELADNG